MKYSGLVCLFLFFTLQGQNWTWLYKKSFNPIEVEAHQYRTNLLFSKENTPLFSQLIFSWNGLKPKKGFYRFKVRVRNAAKKTWYAWHTMAEWGENVQRSFLDKTVFGTQFHHVRLEVPNKHLADALNIKVEACNGADCSLLRNLYVSISNLGIFKSESLELVHDLCPIHIKKVPTYSQMELDHPKKEVLCSPTSCSMLISYLLNKKIDPVHFAQSVHDKGLDAFGSWPFNIAHAYEFCNEGYGFRVQRLPSFTALHSLLQKKIPVVVSVRGSLEGAPKEYNDGHLLVVVGWDPKQKKVICHDPAFESSEKTCVFYGIKSFLQAWERSRRLAYVAENVKK